MKKYIVTGGHGFIGSKIAEKTGGQSFDLKAEQDILDHEHLCLVCENAHGIFHCAGKISVPESIVNPEEYYRTNVEGTKSVIDVANKTNSSIVFSSSAAVYGEQEGVVSENSATNPMSPYAENKLEGEKLLMSMAKVPGVILRYFNVYGPGQSSAYAGVITIFIENALKGKDLIIYGDGSQRRDFIFVDDVVDANIAAMDHDSKEWEIFNIANGDSISILELAKKIIEITGSSSQIVFAPGREGDIHHSEADISKAKQILNWRPKVSLEDGLKKTVDYIKQNIA